MSLIARNFPQVIPCRKYAAQAPGAALITVPKYVEKHIERAKALREERRIAVLKKNFKQGDINCPIITSNNKEYNFYLGQVYNKYFPIPIISKYWLKPKSAGQKFTIMPWDKNPSLPVKLEDIPTQFEGSQEFSMAHYISEFHQLGLSKNMLSGISLMGYQYPTPIQSMAIPKIMKHKHTLCVSESGSGKTMSYLIPIIESLQHIRNEQDRFPNTPLALIIVPGRELAEQIAMLAYQLGMCCGVNVKLLLSEGTHHDHLIPRHYEPMDILVATFGIMLKMTHTRVFNLSHLRHLVFDEADTLLDKSFEKERDLFLPRIMATDTIANPDSRHFGAQIISVSTTMPTNLDSFFDYTIADVIYERAVSPHIHRVLPHVKQKFIRVNNPNRAGHLLDLVKENLKVPTMIFSNKFPTCEWLSHFLRQNDVPHVKFHSQLNNAERSVAFERFQSGDVDILCCTDLASRGLDTQRVRHVINFDFPNSISDYILRAGRVGRVGTNQGHVTNLIVSKSGVYVVQDIEMAVRQSTQLPNVDADIKKKIFKLFHKH